MLHSCGENCNCKVFHKDILEKVERRMIADDQIKEISNFLQTIGSFTRVKILDAIKDEKLCVCDIAYLLNMTKSAVSHQMRNLSKLNLVTSQKVGKMVYYKVKNTNINNLIVKVKQILEEKNNETKS